MVPLLWREILNQTERKTSVFSPRKYTDNNNKQQ